MIHIFHKWTKWHLVNKSSIWPIQQRACLTCGKLQVKAR